MLPGLLLLALGGMAAGGALLVWTFLEWRLDDAAQWDAWVGGNGAITASTVTLDAIWFYRAQTSYNVQLYVDNVQVRN